VDSTPVIIRLVAARGFVRAPPNVGLLGLVRSRLQPASVTAAAAVTRLAKVRLMVEILPRTMG
jgi:hypothetical protein